MAKADGSRRGRPRRKHHRELAGKLAALGFIFVGLDGRDHLVFRRDTDGRGLHPPGSPRSEHMNIKIALVRARRERRAAGG
jgi:hypothetical protein